MFSIFEVRLTQPSMFINLGNITTRTANNSGILCPSNIICQVLPLQLFVSPRWFPHVGSPTAFHVFHLLQFRTASSGNISSVIDLLPSTVPSGPAPHFGSPIHCTLPHHHSLAYMPLRPASLIPRVSFTVRHRRSSTSTRSVTTHV